MARDRSRPARLLLAVLVVAVAGCSSAPKDPAEVRRDRVETRLTSSFSANQASCIVDALDPATLRALDRRGSLPPDSQTLARYSAAVTRCVTGSTGSTTTTTGG